MAGCKDRFATSRKDEWLRVPQGLKVKDILLEAKILAVADVVESIATHQPYRPALGIKKALRKIRENKEILYDWRIVDICLKLFTKKRFKFA